MTSDTLLFRQVNENWLQQGVPSSQTFRPTQKDNGKGGIKGGMTYGATDDFGWHAQDNKVHVHELHATILHLMGINHEKLTYRFSGRDYRLTDVHGNVVRKILA